MHRINEVDGTVQFILIVAFLLPLALYCLKALFIQFKIDNVQHRPVGYQDIVNAALVDAANGDANARNWVMENVFMKADPAMINDAVAGLKSLGYKVSEAKAKVNALVAKGTYSCAEDIIVDAINAK